MRPSWSHGLSKLTPQCGHWLGFSWMGANVRFRPIPDISYPAPCREGAHVLNAYKR